LSALAFAATPSAILAQVAGVPALDDAVKIEIQRQSDELRRQYLDDRAESLTWWAKSINWWLAGVAALFTIIGIAVPIVLTISFRHNAREAVKEAQGSSDKASEAADKANELVKKIEEHEQQARKYKHEMCAIRDSMTESARVEQSEKIPENIQQHPELKRMISQAHSLQKSGETEKAIRKWRAIVNFARGIDMGIVSFAWFSVGYLADKPEDKVSVYSEAIHIDPKNLHAFINRGAAKEELARHSDAIEDYDEAIRLNSKCAIAYYNRGAVKAKLGQHESAIEDFDEAIRLDPEDFYAYFNRGNVKGALGLFDEARSDLQTALKLAEESGNKERAARISDKIREIDNIVAKQTKPTRPPQA